MGVCRRLRAIAGPSTCPSKRPTLSAFLWHCDPSRTRLCVHDPAYFLLVLSVAHLPAGHQSMVSSNRRHTDACMLHVGKRIPTLGPLGLRGAKTRVRPAGVPRGSRPRRYIGFRDDGSIVLVAPTPERDAGGCTVYKGCPQPVIRSQYYSGSLLDHMLEIEVEFKCSFYRILPCSYHSQQQYQNTVISHVE
ncbi:hypothetical protein BV22DRAFT_613871 [Leucogyrophana mollusca]|uniref:Uncharacterized protein n=1 Tax=Leucogyrophana mollusca TaxID=85980 RepID=A0ACB8BC46_9AGAM|nr:hypothetical protein BV22DRAFT_613871 [Leucogyrophana mollusca]